MYMSASAVKSSRESLLAVAVIVTSVALLYGHTLHAPFYLDDQWAIIDKHLLRDLPAALGNIFSQRGLTNLSFALNYRLTELSLPALHLTNVALHAGCGILVWLLLRKLLQRPRLAFLGALLFVAHPLQTQAVTYLIQRATVLGTFFFLVACLLHLRCRRALTDGYGRASPKYLWPWLGAITAGACAVLAKENTATLPLLLMVYDRFFPLPSKRNWRQALGDYLPYFIVPSLLGVMMLLSPVKSLPTTFILASMEGSTPLIYLVTQFSVVWIYLRLLFLPYGQALEHNYPVITQVVTLQNAAALAGLLVLAWLAWRVRRQRPLLVFGVAWFFLALAVESSIIPLDPLFEHRLYLPMTGFLLVLLDGLPALLGEKWSWAVLTAVLVLFAPLAWRRNALWNDPIALYEDNLRQVPDSERASETLAVFYARAGRYDEERQLLEKTLRQYPRNYIVCVNLAKTYAEEQRMDEAYALLEEGFRQMPTNTSLYETAAELAQGDGDQQRAVSYFQRGLSVPGANRAVLLNDLGVLYAGIGNPRQAERAFLDSLREDDASAATHLNLAKEYYAQRRWSEALTAFRRALQLEPGNPEILEGLGRGALQLGELETVRWVAGKLRHIDRQAEKRLVEAMIISVKRAQP